MPLNPGEKWENKAKNQINRHLTRQNHSSPADGACKSIWAEKGCRKLESSIRKAIKTGNKEKAPLKQPEFQCNVAGTRPPVTVIKTKAYGPQKSAVCLLKQATFEFSVRCAVLTISSWVKRGAQTEQCFKTVLNDAVARDCVETNFLKTACCRRATSATEEAQTRVLLLKLGGAGRRDGPSNSSAVRLPKHPAERKLKTEWLPINAWTVTHRLQMVRPSHLNRRCRRHRGCEWVEVGDASEFQKWKIKEGAWLAVPAQMRIALRLIYSYIYYLPSHQVTKVGLDSAMSLLTSEALWCADGGSLVFSKRSARLNGLTELGFGAKGSGSVSALSMLFFPAIQASY